MVVEVGGETSRFTEEFVGEIHRVLECMQNHPPRNKHQKRQICLLVVAEVTESWQRSEQVALFPFGLLPHIQHHKAVTWVALLWGVPKALPLTT